MDNIGFCIDGEADFFDSCFLAIYRVGFLHCNGDTLFFVLFFCFEFFLSQLTFLPHFCRLALAGRFGVHKNGLSRKGRRLAIVLDGEVTLPHQVLVLQAKSSLFVSHQCIKC